MDPKCRRSDTKGLGPERCKPPMDEAGSLQAELRSVGKVPNSAKSGVEVGKSGLPLPEDGKIAPARARFRRGSGASPRWKSESSREMILHLFSFSSSKNCPECRRLRSGNDGPVAQLSHVNSGAPKRMPPRIEAGKLNQTKLFKDNELSEDPKLSAAKD